MKLRIVTFNAWNTEGDPGRAAIINRELRQLDPDLLALQEIVRTPDVDMLPQLLDGMNMHVTHQADLQTEVPPFADRYGGAAIASRRPHRVVEVLDQRVTDATDTPWATLAAVVPLDGLGELLFIGTTGAWRPTASLARERQAVALADLDSRHHRDLPTIIAGDLNATPDAASIRFLTGKQSLEGRSVFFHDAWEAAGEGPGFTWTTDNPNARSGAEQLFGQSEYRQRFDYVFVGAPGRGGSIAIRATRLVMNAPVAGLWPSDHFGVLVDVEVIHR
jgi:endonuclease/exonuclease/phosphatase family metal-dependent hydrolase